MYLDIAQPHSRASEKARYFEMVEEVGYILGMLDEFEHQRESMRWQRMCDDYLHNIAKRRADLLFVQYPSALLMLSQHKATLRAAVEWAETPHPADTADMFRVTEDNLAVWHRILDMLENTAAETSA